MQNYVMKQAIEIESANQDTATLDTIYTRRSVRNYKDLPLSLPLIEKIIDAGRMAPSAMNRQPWKFHVLRSRKVIRAFSKEISRSGIKKLLKAGPRQVLKTVAGLFHFHNAASLLKNNDPVFHGAPVVVFISVPKDNEWAALDTGMCVQNMLLAARSLGIDSCPVGFGKFVEETKHFPALHVPAGHVVHIAVIMGYGSETPDTPKRVKNNITYVE